EGIEQPEEAIGKSRLENGARAGGPKGPVLFWLERVSAIRHGVIGVKSKPGAESCVTVMGTPSITKVAVRGAGAGFGRTVNFATPVPSEKNEGRIQGSMA